MNRDRGTRWKCPRSLLLIFTAALAYTLFPSTASAIPAWSRQYDVPCATCHYPAPPRLNSYGHQFRRAQYRLPGEFDKDPDWKKVQNYLAVRVRGRYTYSSAEDPAPDSGTTETSTFQLNDATLFYAGPVTKNFSGFVELERPGDEEIIEAVISAGGIYGKPDSFWTFRLGQFHTLTRVGFGGLDRPTGISTPDALSRDLTSSDSAFSGGTNFKLNQDQIGIEGTYVRKNWRIIGQILNGPDTSGSTTDHSDDNKQKDGVLAFELMWGETASGFTAFAYRGVQDDPDLIGSGDDKVAINRYGVTAAQVWKNGMEVQGGFVLAKDTFDEEFDPVFDTDPNSPTFGDLLASGQQDVDGRGWWVEVEKYWENAHDLTIFGRFDQTDPNKDVDDSTRSKITAGFVWPVAGWHVRWGLELSSVKQQTVTEDLSTNQAVAELMLNF